MRQWFFFFFSIKLVVIDRKPVPGQGFSRGHIDAPYDYGTYPI